MVQRIILDSCTPEILPSIAEGEHFASTLGSQGDSKISDVSADERSDTNKKGLLRSLSQSIAQPIASNRLYNFNLGFTTIPYYDHCESLYRAPSTERT
jgi:hypothetical protein